MLTIPAAAQAHVQPLAASYTDLSVGRGAATIAALLALLGVAVAMRTLLRARRRHHDHPGRGGGLVATVAGAIAAVLGAVVIATADGGLGTGNGLGGGYVAVLASVLSLGLGGVILVRHRRATG